MNGFDPLRELAESHGPVGHEDEPRGLVAGEPESAVDRVRTDAMGNVVGTGGSTTADGATDADGTADADRLLRAVLIAAVIVRRRRVGTDRVRRECRQRVLGRRNGGAAGSQQFRGGASDLTERAESFERSKIFRDDEDLRF